MESAADCSLSNRVVSLVYRYVDQFKAFIARGGTLIEQTYAAMPGMRDALRRSESLVDASKELSQDAKLQVLTSARDQDKETNAQFVARNKIKGYLNLHKQRTLGEAWTRV